jgi:hypothetical protein
MNNRHGILKPAHNETSIKQNKLLLTEKCTSPRETTFKPTLNQYVSFSVWGWNQNANTKYWYQFAELFGVTYILTYLLTPCSRILLEKLTVSQLVKKFPEVYGTWRFNTAFTSPRHLSLSWAHGVTNQKEVMIAVTFVTTSNLTCKVAFLWYTDKLTQK